MSSSESNEKSKDKNNLVVIQELQARIQALEKENAQLKQQQQQRVPTTAAAAPSSSEPKKEEDAEKTTVTSTEIAQLPPLLEQQQQELSKDQIERYSRQLLLEDGFGVAGQLQLASCAVLVVGAGGIGSTVLLYLAAAGIGRLGVVDYDVVERSNLHRQIIHKDAHAAASVKTNTVSGCDGGSGGGCNGNNDCTKNGNGNSSGMNKAVSARRAVQELNPDCQCHAISVALTHDNALDLFSAYHVIVDASDNPATRYLINDAAVLCQKPVVSASAVGTEGQLTVYNHSQRGGGGDDDGDSSGGPCYRCLYPKPPQQDDMSSSCMACSDVGVLGPVPGLMGILQAMETIKLVTGLGSTTMHDRLLMYDALQGSFLRIKKPPRSPTCPVCSTGTARTIRTLEDSRANLAQARGPSAMAATTTTTTTTTNNEKKNAVVRNGQIVVPPNAAEAALPKEAMISCREYQTIIQEQQQQRQHVLLDVRVTKQFEMCALPGAVNIPLARVPDQLDRIADLSDQFAKPIYCICRRGVASAEAARILRLETTKTTQRQDSGNSDNNDRRGGGGGGVYTIRGGLNAWHDQVDSSFPYY